MNCVNDNNVCSASVCLSERFAGGRSKRTRPLLVGRGSTSGRSGRKQQAWREPSDLDAH